MNGTLAASDWWQLSDAPPTVVGDWLAIVVFYRIADMAL